MSGEREPLKGTDYVYEEPPWWAVGPLKRVSTDFTYDEAHAVLLGLVGIPVGLTWVAGLRTEASVLTVTLIGIAFGLKRLPDNAPIAGRVLRREPWYFTTVFILMQALTLVAMEVPL